MPSFGREPLHDRHAAVEVRVERQHQRAVGERLHELRGRDLRPRQDDDRRNAGRRRVGRERGRRVACRGTGDGADAAPVGDHLLDDRHEHGHPEVLERSGVRVAAHLHPEILDTDRSRRSVRPRRCSCRPRPSRRRSRRESPGQIHSFLPQTPGPVRPRGALVAIVEQAHPRHRAAMPQRVDVVRDLQQLAAGRAVIDRLPDGVLAVASGNATKDGSIVAHGLVP